MSFGLELSILRNLIRWNMANSWRGNMITFQFKAATFECYSRHFVDLKSCHSTRSFTTRSHWRRRYISSNEWNCFLKSISNDFPNGIRPSSSYSVVYWKSPLLFWSSSWKSEVLRNTIKCMALTVEQSHETCSIGSKSLRALRSD